MGHGKPGKSWNLIVSHRESCKIEGYLVNFVIFPAVHKIDVHSCKKKELPQTYFLQKFTTANKFSNLNSLPIDHQINKSPQRLL